MGLARDLVGLANSVRRRPELDLFSPRERGGLSEEPGYSSMVARVRATDAESVVRLCLQALRIQYDELQPNLMEAELVATLPPEAPGIARPTARVVSEMIERANTEIILLGYELTDASLVGHLARAALRGVAVIVICDRNRGVAKRLLDAWPTDKCYPRVFCDRQRPEGTPYASMHAKSLLADGNDLLVTSANFTFHGLHGNIEIGIRVCGSPGAEARKIFSHLVEDGTLEEISC